MSWIKIEDDGVSLRYPFESADLGLHELVSPDLERGERFSRSGRYFHILRQVIGCKLSDIAERVLERVDGLDKVSLVTVLSKWESSSIQRPAKDVLPIIFDVLSEMHCEVTHVTKAFKREAIHNAFESVEEPRKSWIKLSSNLAQYSFFELQENLNSDLLSPAEKTYKIRKFLYVIREELSLIKCEQQAWLAEYYISSISDHLFLSKKKVDKICKEQASASPYKMRFYFLGLFLLVSFADLPQQFIPTTMIKWRERKEKHGAFRTLIEEICSPDYHGIIENDGAGVFLFFRQLIV